MSRQSDKSHETSALVAGIAAFTTWGLVPIYWKLLKAVPATEILAHRFIWTSIFLIALLTWQHRWTEVETNVRSRRASLYCLASGSMIAITWFLYIWAVNIGRVIETSLGYFMTPLMNVSLGAIFLRERLRRWQLASVLLGTIGVLNLTFGYGRFPWVALSLCTTFGLYGLLRKKSGTAAIPGLFIETVLLVPLAIAYLIFLKTNGQLIVRVGGHFTVDLVGEHRHRHRLAAGLVRARRAAFAPYHPRLFAIPRADRHIFPRCVCLPRTIHAQSSHRLRIDLDRTRDLYR
jgi:RarD protein